MFRSLTAGWLTLLFLGCTSAVAGAQDAPPIPARAIVMASGLGEVTLQADRATVSITVRTIAEKPDRASSLNRSEAEAVTGALESLDIDSLRSTGLRVGPNRQYTADGPKDAGYFAERSLRVSTDDLSEVGEIIASAVGAGATEIDNVAYSSSKEASARRQALAKAVENARADAAAVAAAAGGRLGEVVLLSSGGVNVPRPMYRLQSSALEARGGRPNALAVELPEPEDLTITANVEIHWVFEPGG